mgnify:CR=1 FL=1
MGSQTVTPLKKQKNELDSVVSSLEGAIKGYQQRIIQDYLGHRDPKHTALYTRISGKMFDGIW